MTTEELSKERWIVIAPFPWSPATVGMILKDEETLLSTNFGNDEKIQLSKYPHLFRKLEWWEHRKLDDMPEYVKILDEDVICKVTSIAGGIGFAYKETDYFTTAYERKKIFSNNTTPSTLEEYTNYISSKQLK